MIETIFKTPSHIKVIKFLAAYIQERYTVTQLSELLDLSRPTVTNVLKDLTKSHVIKRDKKRKYSIDLSTPVGTNLVSLVATVRMMEAKKS